VDAQFVRKAYQHLRKVNNSLIQKSRYYAPIWRILERKMASFRRRNSRFMI